MRKLDQWVCWKLEPTQDGKTTKVPYQTDGWKADSTKPETWTSFDRACEALATGGDFSGIGYVLSASDPYTFIDLDHCRDSQTGVIDRWAQEIIDRFRSHTELSPSGTGVHIFIRGKLPTDSRHQKKITGQRDGAKIEIYDQERFATMTGDYLEGTP